MPGQKLTRSVYEALEEIGGEEIVFGWLADGETVAGCTRKLAAEYGEEYPALADVSRGILSAWCNRPGRKERYLEARRLGAIAFAEESVEILDRSKPETAYVDKNRSDARRWFAGKLDHDAWGKRDTPMVQLNVNQMHLEAVRELGALEHQGGRRLEQDVVDGEIVDDRGWLDGEGGEPEDEDWAR